MSRVHSPQAAHTHRADGPAVLDLIERLEKAEAGNLTLSEAVLTALGYVEARVPMDSCLYWRSPNGAFLSHREEGVTTSLDAALALAERALPGWGWSGGGNLSGADRDAYARLDTPDGCDFEEAYGPTPALALCIAVLRATTPAEADAVGTEPKAECAQ